MRKGEMRKGKRNIVLTFEQSLQIGLIRSKNDKIQHANSYSHTLFGFGQLVGHRRSSLFMTPADLDNILQSKKEPHQIRILFKKNHGQFFWGLLTSRMITMGGVEYVDDMIIDVSARVELEQELYQKESLLDKASSELDRFIYSASHQLRGPLATVLGLVELLEKDGKQGLSTLLPMIRETVGKLDLHIKKLADFIRIKNEPLSPTKFEIKKFIQKHINNLRSHPNFVNVRFSIEDTVGTVCIDQKKAGIVLNQVLKNCLDFIDTTKKRCTVRVTVKQNYQLLQIEILDNGIGIPKTVLPKVFKMFYRGNVKSDGSGLGLFIAEEATRNLQGSIQIQSEVGLGTVVKVSLPT